MADGDDAGAVSAMVDFLGADVDTVVLGKDVSEQVRWLSLARTLRLPFAHIVADVGDAIVNEAYPAEAEGLRAVAATRVAWFARAHGETAAQRRCRERYAKAAGATTPPTGELVQVYLWCQHVALGASLLDAGLDVARAWRDPFDSPMTSPLTPTVETGFGPRDVAVLEWRSACRCWTEARPYSPRRGMS